MTVYSPVTTYSLQRPKEEEDDYDRLYEDEEEDELDAESYDATADEGEPASSSSYADSSVHGSPQTPDYLKLPSSPRKQPSMSLYTTNSSYNTEDDKLLGSLQVRFPFLKEERKRTRKLLTPEQTRVLEAILEKTVYPSTPLREAIARQLGIPPRKVQIWFQNKRQGRRRVPGSDTDRAPQGHNVNRPSRDRIDRSSDYHHLSDEGRAASAVRLERRLLPHTTYAGTIPRNRSSSPSHHRHHYSTVRGDRDSSSRFSEGFARVFASAANLTSPLLQVPSPVNHYDKTPSSNSSWTPCTKVRARPPHLSLTLTNRQSSDDSLRPRTSDYRDDCWSSTRTCLSSSSSSATSFVGISDGSHLRRSRSSCAILEDAPRYGKDLKLAPLLFGEVHQGAGRRSEVLPSISELIRV
ncbi:hypothetical protein CBS101457_006035 [Exobasidium rhododendri]|nr:hypothetical protein CBS101457_006035 [Exobasidium rhododendri]